MGLLSPRGSQITTTTVAGTGYVMIMTRERCLLVLEFFFCFFFDQGIGSRSAAWASRVDVVWVSVCVSSVVGCWSYVWCIVVSLRHLYALYVSPYIMLCRCNDIQLAKACQYAVLSLVGPSSLFRIVSHIGSDILSRNMSSTWKLLTSVTLLYQILCISMSCQPIKPMTKSFSHQRFWTNMVTTIPFMDFM